jgi:hypothetical protein
VHGSGLLSGLGLVLLGTSSVVIRTFGARIISTDTRQMLIAPVSIE